MSYQLPSADVFTKISDTSEKARLFADLGNGKSEMLAKLPDPAADVFTLMSQQYKNGTVFCKVVGAHPHFPTHGEIILYFFIGGEKYFYQTDFNAGQQHFLNPERRPPGR